MAKKTEKIIKPSRVMVCFKCSKCSKKIEKRLDHLVMLGLLCPKCQELYIDSYMNITGIYVKEK